MSALRQVLSKKTDSQLLYYIDHTDKHTPDAVLAALNELKSRNVGLPENIDEIVTQRMKQTDSIGNKRQWDHFDKDVEVIQLYSRDIIYLFAFLFSALYSSFLLASNLTKLGKPGYPPVLVAAIFIIAVLVFNAMLPGGYLVLKFGCTLLANAAGGVLIYALFPSTPDRKVVVRNGDLGKAILVGIAFSMTLGLLVTIFSK